MQRPLNDVFGVYGFFLTKPHWAQAYGGVSLRLRPLTYSSLAVTVGAGGGIEQTDTQWRGNVFLNIDLPRVSLTNNFEIGAHDYFHVHRLKVFFWERAFYTGIFAKRPLGVGPLIGVNHVIGGLPIGIAFAGPLYRWIDGAFGNMEVLLVVQF